MTIASGHYLIKQAYYNSYVTPPEISYETGLGLNVATRITDSIEALRQIWSIVYQGNGRYTISPIYKEDLYLTAYGSTLVKLEEATSTNAHLWMIEEESAGYVVRNYYYDNYVLTGEYGNTGYTSAQTDGDYDDIQNWQITAEDAEGLLLLDSTTGERMDTGVSQAVFDIYVDEPKTLAQLGLDLHIFDPDNASQAFTVSFTPSNAATFNGGTYTIEGAKTGAATARVVRAIGGTAYNLYFNVHVYLRKEVTVLCDRGYLLRYGSPGARDLILLQMEELETKYLDVFDIIIEYSDPTLFLSYADTCTASINDECTHGCTDTNCAHGDLLGENCAESVCRNSIYNFDTNGTVLHGYHHKNINNIAYRITPDPDATTLAFIGHHICYRSNLDSDEYVLGNHNNNTPSNTELFGVYYNMIDVALLVDHTDTDVTDPVHATFTLVHEFGHSVGAPDHYDQGETATLNGRVDGNPFNDDCIYGFNNYKVEIYGNLTICAGCQGVINGDIVLP